MNELSRHIEILLLSNDCVIVPNFGGFMAHHSPAEYDEETGMFYPPQRTLGFNSQLTLNDSLLAQSYVEAYDISYPEAVLRIENEIAEIKQTIAIEGEYEFHGIGTITQNANGIYDFEPCMAGLLTPDLYALNSFSIDPLHEEEKKEEKKVTPAIKLNTKKSTHYTIYALKNIAAAAMILMLFVFSSIPAGLGSNKTISCSVIDTEFITSFINSSTLLGNYTKEASACNRSNNIDTATADSKQEFVNVKVEKEDSDVKAGKFFIVLASRVSKSGAEKFIAQLENEGLKDARMHESGSMRKVIYGAYNTKAEADASLRTLKAGHSSFEDGWVDSEK